MTQVIGLTAKPTYLHSRWEDDNAMANLGPKAGEANHFRRYAPERLPYALDRFGNEMSRLYGVMNTRLKDHRFLAGRYSIADMACVGWIRLFERQQEKEGGKAFRIS